MKGLEVALLGVALIIPAAPVWADFTEFGCTATTLDGHPTTDSAGNTKIGVDFADRTVRDETLPTTPVFPSGVHQDPWVTPTGTWNFGQTTVNFHAPLVEYGRKTGGYDATRLVSFSWLALNTKTMIYKYYRNDGKLNPDGTIAESNPHTWAGKCWRPN